MDFLFDVCRWDSETLSLYRPCSAVLTTLFQTCYFPETLSRIATFDLPRKVGKN